MSEFIHGITVRLADMGGAPAHDPLSLGRYTARESSDIDGGAADTEEGVWPVVDGGFAGLTYDHLPTHDGGAA
jgi:hypothetical protein